MADLPGLRINKVGDPNVTEQLTQNLIRYFDWGFLDKGGFVNINTNSIGPVANSSPSLFRPVNDPQFPIVGNVARAWESRFSNWVWESGLTFGSQPIYNSGVYLNGVFTPNTGQYYIDYPRGRIVFNTGIAKNTTVNANFAYKWIGFHRNDVPQFREVIQSIFQVSDRDFVQVNSGVFNIFSQNRISLPAVFVHVVPIQSFKPYQLGGGQILTQRVHFHIFTDNSYDGNNIADAIQHENFKSAYLYNIKNVPYPLDSFGKTHSSTKTFKDVYLELQDFTNSNYFYGKTYFRDSQKIDIIDDKIFVKTVSLNCEIEMTNL